MWRPRGWWIFRVGVEWGDSDVDDGDGVVDVVVASSGGDGDGGVDVVGLWPGSSSVREEK